MIARLILRAIDRRQPDLELTQRRTLIGKAEAWVSMAVNFVLAVVKGFLGAAIGSLALIADAIHTVSDVATSAVVLVGFRISGKPADKEHPFGHGRAEYVATLIIAVMLGVVGFEFIKSAVERLLQPVPITANWPVLVTIVLTIVIKEWLGRFSLALGQLIDSSTLKADAWHHRSDAISSILVLAAVWGSSAGYPALDGIGGVGVGLFLLWSGYKLAREVIDPLLGEPPSPALIQQVRVLCRTQEPVYDAHDIVVHNYGHHSFISLHAEVKDDLSAQDAHDIAEDLSEAIRRELGAYATVHIDPINPDSEKVAEVGHVITALLEETEVITGFHDLRVVDTAVHEAILLDIDVDNSVSEGKKLAARKWLIHQLLARYPDAELSVLIAPVHAFR